MNTLLYAETQSVFETPEDYYRKTYFEVIDIIVLELSQRFSQDLYEFHYRSNQPCLKPQTWLVTLKMAILMKRF